ncbi:ABC transporter permease [Butyrivibrio sp. AE3004]|uniref:ABC transporter permease n=1 Tax=Butyrivibrio sp. AE3004 TaxID=1506994 RepID=UPI00068BC5B2|nr:ABC transporter permease [Butyrivibrio sp. AE3004]
MIKLFRQNKTALISGAVILIVVILSTLAPLMSNYNETGQDLAHRLMAPGNGHLFGTDELGRDVFTRILYGTRVSLLIALLPTALAVVVGTFAGVCSALFNGVIDFIIMRSADVMLSIPGMLLSMVVLYTFGGSLSSVVIALVLVEWGGIARIVRTKALEIYHEEYIEAAVVTGAGQGRIIFNHILPNLIPTLIVLFTLNIPSSILAESTLSFLGIGIQPPQVSLGLMTGYSRQYLFQMPWLALAPSGMVMLLVLSFNFFGDAVRDILDPKRRPL